jgi:hypothetical protein
MVYRRGVGVMEGKAMAAVPPKQAPSGGSAVERALEKATTNPAALSPSTSSSSGAAVAAPLPLSGGATTSPAAEEQTDIKRDIERALPPLQVHVVLAGFAVAAALAALGLSLRAANTARAATLVEPADELSDLAAAYGARPVRPGRDSFDPSPGTVARVDVVDRSRVPSARFWLLAALLAVMTGAFGWWVLLRSEEVQNMWDFAGLWNAHVKDYPRRMFHVIAAGAIVMLPLVLAIIARAAPRQRGLIFLLSLLLIGAVAVQVWLGVLLMWDTPEGGVRGFNS